MTEKFKYPKKNMASGAIIYDKKDRFLVVKPTYKDYWHLPGGVVEENESPYIACIREVQEEVNLVVKPNRLLAVNYTGIPEEGIDALVFIFECGTISEDRVSNINIPKEEIMDNKFIEKQLVFKYLDGRMAKIVAECFGNKESMKTLYLENMTTVL